MATSKSSTLPVYTPGEFISLEELRNFSKLTPWRSYVSILLQYSGIASAIWFSEFMNSWPITILCLAFIGARLYSLGILLHEGLHYRLSNNKKWNDRIMKYFLAWPIFINPITFRENHSEHHKHLHTEDDPEMSRKSKKFWSFPMKQIRLITLLFLDLTSVTLPFIIFSHKNYFSGEKRKKKSFDWVKFLYYGIIFSALIYFGLFTGFLLYWFLPIITWCNFLLRVRRISEHCGLEINPEMISRSRTTKINLLERIFIAPCHVNFHNEHHLFPSVPFYRLPELHERLMTKLNYRDKVQITQGYWGVFKECTV